MAYADPTYPPSHTKFSHSLVCWSRSLAHSSLQTLHRPTGKETKSYSHTQSKDSTPGGRDVVAPHDWSKRRPVPGTAVPTYGTSTVPCWHLKVCSRKKRRQRKRTELEAFLVVDLLQEEGEEEEEEEE
jgi:hypothetical protein